MISSRTIAHPRRTLRAGYTLVELLTATALALMVIAILANIFGQVSQTINHHRATITMRAQVRQAAELLRNDLKSLTVTCEPPRDPRMNEGYFEIVEGPAGPIFWPQNRTTPTYVNQPLPDLTNPATATAVKQEWDTRQGDYDDILLFTARAYNEPFVGLNEGRTTHSKVAEIAWFLRGTTLYRRVLLVGPVPVWNNGWVNPREWPGGHANFYGFCDVSAHLESGNNDPTYKSGQQRKLVANTLSDLTSRQNRFGHQPYVYPHDIRFWGDLRLPTLGECSANPGSGNWPFPWYNGGQVMTAPALNPTPGMLYDANGLYGSPLPFNELNPVTGEHNAYNGLRAGEDVVMRNVLAFDVKVYDPGAPIFKSPTSGEAVMPGEPEYIRELQRMMALDLDSTGIALNGGSATLKDPAGNDTTISHPGGNSIADTSDIVIDTSTPSVPVVTGSIPTSPAQDDITPEVSGTGDANENIELFTDSGCTNSIGTGTTDGFGDFSFTGTVPVNTTQTIYANSYDNAGNTSACSATSTSYENYTIASGVAWIYGTQTTNSTNINQSTAYAIEFDNGYVDTADYTHSRTSNPQTLTVDTAGDYFAAVTIPMVSGVVRSAVRAEIRHNGTAVSGCIGESSMIRNSNNHDNSSDHIACFIPSVGASDTLEVYVQQTAASGTTTIVDQATFYVEKITNSRNVFAGTATAVVAGTNFNQATASPLLWTESRDDSEFSHSNSVNPEIIDLVNGGDYFVTVNVPTSGTISRGNIIVSIKLDGTTVNGGEAKQGFIRNTSGHNNSSVHWSGMLYDVSPGQDLTITTEREANGGTIVVTSSQAASIFVEKIDTANDVFFSSGTELVSGTNWNPLTASSVKWSVDDIIDTSVFTHSTSTNSHQITVDQTGDYLLSYNDSLTSTVARSAPRIKVLKNGSPISGAISSTHYIRASNGHNESSASLVFFLWNLQAGDILTVTSQADGSSGTVNDDADALFYLQKK